MCMAPRQLPCSMGLQRQVQRPQAGPVAPPPGTHTLRSSSCTLAEAVMSLLRQGHKSTRLLSICWVTLALGAASCPPSSLAGRPTGYPQSSQGPGDGSSRPKWLQPGPQSHQRPWAPIPQLSCFCIPEPQEILKACCVAAPSFVLKQTVVFDSD